MVLNRISHLKTQIERRTTMKERRDFLKGSLIVAGAAVLGNAIQVQAATMFPKGLIYTKESPGRWAGKEGAHAPVATVQRENGYRENPPSHDQRTLHCQAYPHNYLTVNFWGKRFLPTPMPPPSPHTPSRKDSRELSGPQVFVIFMIFGSLNSRCKETRFLLIKGRTIRGHNTDITSSWDKNIRVMSPDYNLVRKHLLPKHLPSQPDPVNSTY